MGRLAPVLAACVLNSNDIYIFRTPANLECFPYTAYIMFLTAVFYLLWNIPLNPYPSCFRGLIHPASSIIEFLVATLLIEVAMTDFWCPLQTKFVAFLPNIPDQVVEAMTIIGVECSVVTEYLEFFKGEEAALAASYALSSFFLVSIMHTTRIIDLRLMRCGLKVFVQDLVKRSKHFGKSVFRPDWYNATSGCNPSFRNPNRRRKSSSNSDWIVEGDSISSDRSSQYFSTGS